MTIRPIQGSPSQLVPEVSRSTSPQSLVRRLEFHLNDQETAFARLKRVRERTFPQPQSVHQFDNWLANPQRFKNRGLRALIYASQYLEELAEICADLSSVAERIVRSTISSGEKIDIPYIMASGVGRVVAAQLNLLGIAMHKAIGGGLYALSALLSIGAVAIIKAGWGGERTDEEFQDALKNTKVGFGISKEIAKAMVNIKEKALKKAIEKTENHRLKIVRNNGKLLRFLSAKHASNRPQDAWKRKTNSSYIWDNLHQYGYLTRALMNTAHGLFQGVNRMAVSFDKRLGYFVGSSVLQKKTGDVLGCRIGMTFAVGGAAAISIPLSPFLVGIWTAGAAACALSVVLIVLAKANIRFNNNWKGNIYAPQKLRFSEA